MVRSRSIPLRLPLLAAGLLFCLPAWAGHGKADPTEAEPSLGQDLEAGKHDATLGLPVMPGATRQAMEGDLQVGDAPIEAQIYFTQSSVDEVMKFYRNNLQARKVRMTEHWWGPHSGHIGFYHLESQTMRLAIIQPIGTGGTMIIHSAQNPLPLMSPMKIPEDLPGVASAVKVVTSESEESGSKSKTVFFEAWGRPEEVLQDLRKNGEAKGWKKASENDQRLSDLTLQRNQEICIIRVSESSNSKIDHPSSSVTMLVIEEHTRKERIKP